jgi:hypothetical protein
MSRLTYTRKTVGAGHNQFYELTHLDVYRDEQLVTRITTRNTLMGDFVWQGVEYKFRPKNSVFVGRTYVINGDGQKVGEVRLGRNAFTTRITALTLPQYGTYWLLPVTPKHDTGITLENGPHRISYKPEVYKYHPQHSLDHLTVSEGEIETGGANILIALLGLCIRDLDLWDVEFQESSRG